MNPPNAEFEESVSSRMSVRGRVVIVTGGLLMMAAIALTSIGIARKSLTAKAANPPAATAASHGIACFGRIEPQNGVLTISAPWYGGGPPIVGRLMVKEGDKVRGGDVLAVLITHDQLEAALLQARAQTRMSEAKLANVKLGVKVGDLNAQREENERLRLGVENSLLDYRRYAALYEAKVVALAEYEARKFTYEAAVRAYQEGKQRLAALEEIRDTDVAAAQADLESNRAAVKNLEAQLAMATVRAPIDGRVLTIRAHEGEQVGPGGVIDLGSEQMYVSAEVYETDVTRIKQGDKAYVTSDLFQGTLTGRVETIGSQVSKSEVLPGDPVQFADNRIVKVKVRLDDSKSVDHLIRGKVNVEFRP